MLHTSGKYIVALLLVALALPNVGATAQEPLTQTYNAPDGSFALAYPAGWVFQVDSTGLVLANNAQSLSALEGALDQPPPGTLIVAKMANYADMANGQISTDVDYTPLELATVFRSTWQQMDTDNIVDPPQAATVGGREAAQMRIRNVPQNIEGLIVVTEIANQPHVFMAIAPLNELAASEATVLAIVGSLEAGTVQAQVTAVPVLTPITYGQSVSGTITGGLEQRWTFNGAAGDVVRIAVTAPTLDTVLQLLGLDGTELTSDDDSGEDLNPLIDGFSLPQSGAYTIVVRPWSSSGSGGYQIELTVQTITPPGMLVYGDEVTANMLKPVGDRWTFVGVAGDRVTIRMEASFDSYLELHDSSGATLITNDDGGGGVNAQITQYELPANGTYAIIARSYSSSTTGRYTLSLAKAEPQVPTEITVGTVVYATLEVSTGDTWLFAGEANDRMTIVMAGSFDTVLELYGPDGTQVASNDDTAISYTSIIEDVTLPQTGQYRVVARAYSSGTGPYVLMVGHAMPAEVTR